MHPTTLPMMMASRSGCNAELPISILHYCFVNLTLVFSFSAGLLHYEYVGTLSALAQSGIWGSKDEGIYS